MVPTSQMILLAQAPPGGEASLFGMLAPLGLIMLIFYFLLWRPQSKQAAQHREFLGALKSGDEVVTAGGLLGTVKSVDDHFVTLEISKGNKVSVLKTQIKGPRSAFEKSDSSGSENK